MEVNGDEWSWDCNNQHYQPATLIFFKGKPFGLFKFVSDDRLFVKYINWDKLGAKNCDSLCTVMLSLLLFAIEKLDPKACHHQKAFNAETCNIM